MVLRRLRAERERGRAFQPRFNNNEIVAAWLGGVLAITALGWISAWSHDPLVVAPFIAVLFHRLRPASTPYPHHWI